MTDVTVTLRLTANPQGVVTGVSVASGSLKQLGDAAEQTSNRATSSFGKTRAGIQSISAQLAEAQKRIVQFMAFDKLVDMGKELAKMADEWTNVGARLNLATKGAVNTAAAMEQVYGVAQSTSTAVGTTGELVAGLTKNLTSMGMSSAQAFNSALSLTKTINQAFAVSGATSDAQKYALTQFQQSLAAGVVRAQEFNSVVEQAPRLGQAMADGMKMSMGQLRAAVDNGQVSAQRMLEAIASQGDVIQSEFNKMPLTINRAWQQLENAVLHYVGTADQASQSSNTVAKAIKLIADNIDPIIDTVLRVSAVTLAYFAMVKVNAVLAAQELALMNAEWAASSPLAALAGAAGVGALKAVQAAGGVLFAAFAGWQIGSWLYDQFAIVRVAGQEFVGNLVKGWNYIKLVATLAWDTIKAAVLGAINTIRSEFADYLEFVAKGTSLLPNALGGDAMAAKLRSVEAAVRPTSSAWDDYTKSVSTAVDANKQQNAAVDQVTGELVAYQFNQENAAASTDKMTGSTNDLAVALKGLGSAAGNIDWAGIGKSISDKVKQQQVEIAKLTKGNGASAQLQYDFETGAAKVQVDQSGKSSVQYDQSVLNSDNYKNGLQGNALIGTQQNRIDALNKSLEAHKKALQDATDEQKKFHDAAEASSGALGGVWAQATTKYNKEMDDLTAAQKRGNVSINDANTLRAQYNRELEESAQQVIKAEAAPQALLDTMTGEVKLLGMGSDARALYTAKLRAEAEMQGKLNDAVKAAGGEQQFFNDLSASAKGGAQNYAQYAANIMTAVDAAVTMQQAAKQAAQQAREWSRVWTDTVSGVDDAFAQFVASGLKDFKGFRDSLKSEAKKLVTDLIETFLKQKIEIPLEVSISNSNSILDGGSGATGLLNGIMSLFKGNGYGTAGQSGAGLTGNISSVSSLLSLFGSGTTSTAASSLASTAPYTSSLFGGSATAQLGSTAGATAAAGSSAIAAAIPIAGWVAAGMMVDSSLYKNGWNMDGQRNDIVKSNFGFATDPQAALLSGGISMLLGSVTAIANATVGAADKLLQNIGVSGKWASILTGSSVVARLFGYGTPKVTGQGIDGSYGFDGLDAQSYADIKQSGGLFHGDKKWTQYGAVDPSIANAFNAVSAQVSTSAKALASNLGVDISSTLKNTKVDLGKLQLSTDSATAQQQLQDAADQMVETLSADTVKALGFSDLLTSGFTAKDTMSALGITLGLVNNNAAQADKAMQYMEQQAAQLGQDLTTTAQNIADVSGSYGSLIANAQSDILTAGLSDYQKQALQIEQDYQNQVTQANSYAKSLGLVGARTQDLTILEQDRALKMAGLQKQMEADKANILDGLATSDYSPLNDQQKLSTTMQQLQAAIASGDTSGVQSLAQQALGFGRNLYASGADYNNLYGNVTSMINGMDLPSLDEDDGTTMGDLAETLTDLPQQFAQALFALLYPSGDSSTTADSDSPVVDNVALLNGVQGINDRLDMLITNGKTLASQNKINALTGAMNGQVAL